MCAFNTFADLYNVSLKSMNGLFKGRYLVLIKCIKVLYKFTCQRKFSSWVTPAKTALISESYQTDPI